MLRTVRYLTAVSILSGIVLGLAPASVLAGDSSARLKGIVEKVEWGRFLMDSAWVKPTRKARFSGAAKSVGRIKVGYWAVVRGRWSDGGVFEASRIKIKRDYPGKSFQDGLAAQGLEEAGKIEQSSKTYQNPDVVGYVRRVGDSVVPDWARDQFDFQFNVLSDPSLNAFALPNGSIFIHSGLLARVEDEAQLAAILGHEVAHVTEHHSAQGYKKSLTTWLPAIIGAQVVGAKAGESIDNPFLEAAAQLGLTLTLGAAVNGYGRTHEDQADRVGLRYMVEAGYDPTTAPQVWDIFNRTYGDQSELENFFYSNHSTNQVRKKNQTNEIRRHYDHPESVRVTRQVNTEAYQLAMLPLTRDNAILDFKAKRYNLALSGFDRVLRHHAGDAVAHTYRGRIYLLGSDQPDRFERAEAEFRKATQEDPDYPDAHRELGRLLASRQDKTNAREELRKYLKLAPSDAKDRKEVERELKRLG